MTSTESIVESLLENVAGIIRRQIGVWNLARVGANNFVAGKNLLRFQARGRKAKSSGVIEIELDTSSDTYTLRLWKVPKAKLRIRLAGPLSQSGAKLIDEMEGVQAGELGSNVDQIIGG